MAQEKWQEIRKIFVDVVRQKPEVREGFLKEACNGNSEIRREVESLLSSYDDANSFMETPALVDVGDSIDNPTLSVGQKLKHYEIIKLIGEGGMGEVYLAQDTKLQRKVALKVIQSRLLFHRDANDRLLREARAAAMLNHPNICPIYEIGELNGFNFIVMQFVEGETLSEILEKSRMGIKNSLDLAIQILEALQDAHSNHIIHRDIKPSNIAIDSRGHVKVLDFGLAKFVRVESNAETIKRLEGSDDVMGTIPYMSPEQLRGKRLDTRTDIFSFGSLFFEMLTGRQVFSKGNSADTMSAILTAEPDWLGIPEMLQPIVRKSLMKKRALRYQTMSEIREDLTAIRDDSLLLSKINEEIARSRGYAENLSNKAKDTERFSARSSKLNSWNNSESMDDGEPITEVIANLGTKKLGVFWLKNHRTLLTVLLLSLFGVVALFMWKNQRADMSHLFDSLRAVRLVSWKTGTNSVYSDYRLSNSGKLFAYSSTQNGKNEGIYIKQASDGEDIRVTKDQWVNHSPIWSPDDQQIAFVSVREGISGIYVCPSFGGAVRPIKIIGKGKISLRHWSLKNDVIFYELRGNLFQIDLDTKDTKRVTAFDPSLRYERNFSLALDEKLIVYLDKKNGQEDIWIMSLDSTERPIQITNDRDQEMRPFWHPDGVRILYTVIRGNHYQISSVDINKRSPVQVTRGDSEYEIIGVSRDGTRIFYSSWEKSSDIGRVNVDTREETEIASEIDPEFWTDVSPDGRSILYQKNSEPHLTSFIHKSSIVVKALENDTPRFSAKGYAPRWLADSRNIAFLRWNEGVQKYTLWLFDSLDGTEKQIAKSGVRPPSISLLPINQREIGNFHWSPDSQRLIFISSKGDNLWIVSVNPGEPTKVTNNTNRDIRYESPLWAPNGTRLAYLSNEKLVRTRGNISKIWVSESGKNREVFQTNTSLRLLGWTESGKELFLVRTNGPMKSSPIEVDLVRVSIFGEVRVVSNFNNIYAKSMTLSANGEAVAYVMRQNNLDDIWVAPSANGVARKLTSNNNSKLFFGGLRWSADSKMVYFDKQDQRVSISMFENFN